MLRRTMLRRAGALLAALLCVALAGAPAARAETARLESPHFRIRYDPARLTREQAEAAREAAERAWEKCDHLFGQRPAQKVVLDLTPDFAGATGFARPADLRSTDPKRAPLVGVRYADLDYLGLSADYVLTHEVGHVFSGELARSPLGEGIADWAAGGFAGVPLAPWWGPALQRAGLWVDPEALFINGERTAPRELDARERTARYAEAALLVQYVIDRFGWERFARFGRRYAEAHRPKQPPAERRVVRDPLPPGAPPAPQPRRPMGPPPLVERRLPDPEAVRRVFQETLGEPWAALRADWEAEMAKSEPPPALAERLILAQQIYAAIRNYEMWVLREKVVVPEEKRRAVRQAFTEANRHLAEGDPASAREYLDRAIALVDRLRRPVAVAGGVTAPDRQRG